MPHFIILSNAAIEGVCRRKPHTLAELVEVSGFGPNRVEKYGEELVGLVREESRTRRGLADARACGQFEP